MNAPRRNAGKDGFERFAHGVYVAVGKPWTPGGGLRSAADFVAFDEPGFAKMALEFRALPEGAGSRLETETRVFLTDAGSRRRFAAYWLVVRPFSGSRAAQLARCGPSSRRGLSRAPTRDAADRASSVRDVSEGQSLGHVRNGQYCPRPMRLLVARCEVRYTGRLTAVLPESTRLVLLKSDGSVLVHADSGGYKPLNWMTPPTVIEEEPGLIVVRKRAGRRRIGSRSGSRRC